MVGFNRRYYSIFHKGIKIIREHGKLLGVAVEGHERMWRVRGLNKFSDPVLENWIYANSVHTIDLLRFFGGEVLDLKSITHKYLEPKGDQFAAVMELESGALGNYSAHWHSPGGWRVVLYGEGVTVEFKPLEAGRWTDRDFKTYEIEPDDADKRFKPGFYRQMEAFYKLVQNDTPEWPMLDLYGSYQTMLLAEKMTRGEKK
jgi:predicted dehydrogenase